MKKAELKAKMISKMAAQSIEMLKEMAEKLMDNFNDGADIVYDMVINELESRMPESEFVEFCDSL